MEIFNKNIFCREYLFALKKDNEIYGIFINKGICIDCNKKIDFLKNKNIYWIKNFCKKQQWELKYLTEKKKGE